MCQLLGMNCNVPTDICFSLAGFQARGGLTDVHRDGWGIAFFEHPARNFTRFGGFPTHIECRIIA